MCSMISVQCDELRAMAESVGLEIPKVATLMMEAADTIDRLDAENAKLRELAREMHATISRYNSWWDYACKDTRRFADELRELGVEVRP